MRLAAITLGALLVGCTPKKTDMPIHNGMLIQMPDPNNYVPLLRYDEYIVPDAVLGVYNDLFLGSSYLPRSYRGSYIGPSQGVEHDLYRFRIKLMIQLYDVRSGSNATLTQGEWDYFMTAFSSGNIVIAMTSFGSQGFEQGLQTDRLHKMLDNISNSERAILTTGSSEVLRRNGIEGTMWNDNWKALYLGLSDKEIKPSLKDDLEQYAPAAYKIYQRLLNKTEVN
jgi:hypothetical protein